MGKGRQVSENKNYKFVTVIIFKFIEFSGVFDDPHKHRRPHEHGSSSGLPQQLRDKDREYREKKERERLAAAAAAAAAQQQQHVSKQTSLPGQHAPPQSKQPVSHHHHHRSSSSSDPNKHTRPQMPAPSSRQQEPRDILREATKDIGLREYRYYYGWWCMFAGDSHSFFPGI